MAGQQRGLQLPAAGALQLIQLASSGCRHYFVKEGGRWVCTMCGATR